MPILTKGAQSCVDYIKRSMSNILKTCLACLIIFLLNGF